MSSTELTHLDARNTKWDIVDRLMAEEEALYTQKLANYEGVEDPTELENQVMEFTRRILETIKARKTETITNLQDHILGSMKTSESLSAFNTAIGMVDTWLGLSGPVEFQGETIDHIPGEHDQYKEKLESIKKYLQTEIDIYTPRIGAENKDYFVFYQLKARHTVFEIYLKNGYVNDNEVLAVLISEAMRLESNTDNMISGMIGIAMKELASLLAGQKSKWLPDSF